MRYLLFLIFLNPLFTVIHPIDQQKASPTNVAVGMYVNHVDHIDVANQTFYAEFYLNLKWKGERSANKFEFFNSTRIDRYYYEEWKDRDTNWLTCKVKGTFRSNMIVTDYPFDNHILSIKMSDYEWTADSLTYLINKEITGLSTDLLSVGWDITNNKPVVYTLNDFGAKYSVFEYKIFVARKPASFIIKILIPILIVMGVAFLNLFLPKKEIESCIALGITSLLSIIALHFTISSKLPDVDYATKIDTLMIGSYFLIFLSIVDVVLVYNLHNINRILSKYIDRYAKYIIPILYIIFLLLLFLN